jgi:PST family polysaccharide transporter
MPVGAVTARASWATLAQIGKMVLQFGGVAILTRLLPVSDFGLLAMATLFTTFATLVQDMGTSASLIQRKELTPELTSTVLWLNVTVGVALCLILAAIAPLASALFEEPRLWGVLTALGLVFPITVTGTMPLALLQREGHLRKIAIIELSSGTVGLVAAVIGAMHGMGVYSLVLQQAVGSTMGTCQYWLTRKQRPHFLWSSAEFKKTWAFSSHLVAFNSMNYFARNADNMLIGRFMGTTDLALYSMGYRFVTLPVQFFGSISTRVLLPLYSQKQDRPEEIGLHFLRVLSLISLISGPAMSLLWALREPFVAVLLGPNWLSTADLLAWFAPVGFIQSLITNVGLVMIALGRTRLLRNFGIANSIIFVVIFFVSTPFGIIGVAIGYFIGNLAMGVVTLHVTLRLVNQSLLGFVQAIWKPTSVSVIVGLLLWLLLKQSWWPEPSAWVSFVLLLVFAGVLYLALLFVFARDLAMSVLSQFSK